MQGIPVIPRIWMAPIIFILVKITITYNYGTAFAFYIDSGNSKKKR